MNDNQNNSQNSKDETERIRFDEKDFQNPYSRYYSQQGERFSENQNQDFANPYSKYYKNNTSNSDENTESEQNAEPIDFAVNTHNDISVAQTEATKKNFSRIGVGYALFSAITFAVSLIIANVVFRINEDFYNSTLFMNALTPIALYVFALPVLLIVLSRCEAKTPEKRNMSVKTWFVILVVAFGCMYIGSYIGNFVMAYLSEIMNYDYGNALNSLIDYDALWITAIFTVIVAPIGEELVFRKLIIDRTQKYGAFVSIGLSALMFGLMHGNFYQFFYCFALGLILGYIYYSTGKVWLCIAMHAVINFVGGILTAFLQPVAERLETLDSSNMDALIKLAAENWVGLVFTALFSIFVIISMVCAVVLPIAFRKKITFAQGEKELPRRQVVGTVILNVGVIIMLAVYLMEFGLNLLPF